MSAKPKSLDMSFVKILFFVLLVALGVRVYLAVEYPGSIRPDEIFQYFEPAHKLAFGTWAETWEWRLGIRSWVVPSFIAYLLQLADALHVQNMVLFVRSIFSVLSLLLVALFCWAGWRDSGRRGALLFGIVAALWPDIANASFRTLGEYLGGNLLAGGVILSFIAFQFEKDRQDFARTILLVLAVFILSCASVVRFQFAPGVGISVLYILLKANNKERCLFLFAFIVPVIFLGIFDKITLGNYYQSIFRNFYMNINMGVANKYGVKSAIYYFKKYIAQWGVFLGVVFFLCKKGWSKNSYPLLIGLFVIFYHSIIAHKEVSFIYPAIPLLVFSACLGLVNIMEAHNVGAYKGFFIVSLSLFLFLKTNYIPALQSNSEVAKLQEKAARSKDMCGIMFFGPDKKWGQWSGLLGNSILPKDVPLYMADTRSDLAHLEGKYNYAIAYRGFDFINIGAEELDCDGSKYMCLYKMPNACTGDKDFSEFSKILERRSE